jgi:hypothetical protein
MFSHFPLSYSAGIAQPFCKMIERVAQGGCSIILVAWESRARGGSQLSHGHAGGRRLGLRSMDRR